MKKTKDIEFTMNYGKIKVVFTGGKYEKVGKYKIGKITGGNKKDVYGKSTPFSLLIDCKSFSIFLCLYYNSV